MVDLWLLLTNYIIVTGESSGVGGAIEGERAEGEIPKHKENKI